MTTRTEKAAGRAAHAARMATLHAAAAAIVKTGTCPDCGAPLVRNSAMAGWWQCAGYASMAFRRPGFESLPKCHFQTFTE